MLHLRLTLQGKKGRPGEDGSPGPKGQKVLPIDFKNQSVYTSNPQLKNMFTFF